MALVSLMPALMALRSGDLAAYHGVEHKAIAGYEDGLGRRRPGQGARPLRLAPGDADAGRRGGRERGRAPSGPAWRRGRGRGGPGQRRGGGRGVRLVGAPLGQRRSRACCACPGTRSSAWWARASPRRSSSRWASAALAEILRAEAAACARLILSHGHRGRAGAAARPGDLPAAGRADPRGLLHGRLLQPDEGAARGGGPAAARDDAGVPEAALRARRRRRGDRGAASSAAGRATPERLAARLGRARGARAPRGRRDPAVRDRDRRSKATTRCSRTSRRSTSAAWPAARS